MSAATIEISQMPNLNKIEKLLNDSTYRESIEISASFNTRLCLERKLRLPFIDNQTGVAQNHSNLYMDQRQRMPGLKNGQVYSYPSTRWRKSRRQYLNKLQFNRPFSNIRYRNGSEAAVCTPISNTVLIVPPVVPPISLPVVTDGEQSDFQALIDESNSNPNSVSLDTDSKDSQILKDELPKEWYFYEAEINEGEPNEGSEQGDSDYDYNINGYKRKRKRGKTAQRKPTAVPSTTYHPSVNSSSDSPRKGRPPGSLTGTGTRRCRSKSSRKKLSEPKSESASAEVFQQLEATEPPSFESIEHDLNLNENSNQDAFRKYL